MAFPHRAHELIARFRRLLDKRRQFRSVYSAFCDRRLSNHAEAFYMKQALRGKYTSLSMMSSNIVHHSSSSNCPPGISSLQIDDGCLWSIFVALLKPEQEGTPSRIHLCSELLVAGDASG